MPRLPLLALLLLAGCGGGGDGDDRPAAQASATATEEQSRPEAEPGGGDAEESVRRTGPVTAAEKAVIRGWADALREGDVERAIGYWRAPAIAANGSQPFKLLTRRAIRHFNDGLTCGA